VPWSARFDDPIPLSNGRKLATLRDAALYITKLPKAGHDADEFVDGNGPTILARIGVMRALNRHVERTLMAQGKISLQRSDRRPIRY
jgi:hypothetical protein